MPRASSKGVKKIGTSTSARVTSNRAKKISTSMSIPKTGVEKRVTVRANTQAKKAAIASVEKKRPTSRELKSATKKVIGQYRTAIKNLARR